MRREWYHIPAEDDGTTIPGNRISAPFLNGISDLLEEEIHHPHHQFLHHFCTCSMMVVPGATSRQAILSTIMSRAALERSYER